MFPEYLYKGNIYSPTEKFVGYETCGSLGVSMSVAETFYTQHGVPITEDKTYYKEDEWYKADEDYQSRTDHKYLIKEGYQTNKINLYREPRYYGSIAFRGSLLFGYGNNNIDDMYYFYPKNTNRANPPFARSLVTRIISILKISIEPIQLVCLPVNGFLIPVLRPRKLIFIIGLLCV